jgi:uncharacterized Zn finger protein
VHIGVLPLTKPQWRTVTERLASQALFRAKLLAGEMPHEIEDVFKDCGTPLFPEHADDLDMRCSCPDWGVPCKHLAAVCYVLAEAFDADPFAMLAWRGKGRDDLLAALRSADQPRVRTAAPQRPVLPPLRECVPEFWAGKLSPARLRALSAAPATSSAPDLLLRMYEPPAITVRGKDLADLLRAAYERLAADDAS